MALVTMQDIQITFGAEMVLDHMNLQLHPGEKVGMVGANGSGKSTSFKLIVGDQLALTPPMGWNSWYIHYDRVTEQQWGWKIFFFA